VCGQLHATAALPLGKGPTLHMYKRLDGPQNRSGGQVVQKIRDLTGTRTTTPLSSSPSRCTDWENIKRHMSLMLVRRRTHAGKLWLSVSKRNFSADREI
jgi:hypothetical protein